MQNIIRKNDLKKIQISDITKDYPDLKNITESKAVTIGKWLAEWIKEDLASGKIQVNNLLPSKAEFAYMLGVSTGTIQNALRYLEDIGCVESKQCIGTLIKNASAAPAMRKLTSKRENAIEEIKKYIKSNNFNIGQNLPSSRIIAGSTGCSPNTTRLALEYLCSKGILTHKFKNSRETGWILKKNDFEINESTRNETLVYKVQNDLKNYITKNLNVGAKMPAHAVLAKELQASIKTIHDALKILIDDGILLARRGRYGTTVIKMPDEMTVEQRREISIFAPAQETAFYYYEKTQHNIKKMIAENYSVGMKLPSITELSKQMDLSPNTIRKAFHNLAKEGYLVFSRGRYGGTFVIDIPEMEEQTFKCLAVNPQYTEVYKN